MNSVFIVKLLHLEIDGNLGMGEKLGDHLKITNDRNRIEGLLKPPYRPLLGSLEVETLLSDGAVIFSERQIPDNLSPHDFLVLQFREVERFLVTAWIVLDNSINFEMGFLLYQEGRNFLAHSNLLCVQYTTARGGTVKTRLTREELRVIRKLHSERGKPIDDLIFAPTSQLTAKYPRLTRAFYFISAARKEFDIAIKVSHYCTAFETLFSSSQTELAHQLSERIAYFLFESPEERIANYRKLKTAYNLRSKVVHGSTFKESDLDKSTETADYCDSIARKICHKVLFSADTGLVFEKNPSDFEECMLKLILGLPMSSES